MISNEMLTMVITSGVVGGSLGAMLIGFPLLKKKGVNVEAALSTVDKALNAIQPALDIAKTMAPLNPIVNAAEIIDKYTVIGVKNAEQLYHASKLTGDEDRKNAAKDTVYTALKEFNITPTENQEKLINDTIQAAVGDLGHKNKTEAEKQAAQQALQAENTQLKATNTQLNQTIATITTAATAVNTTQTAQ